MERPPHSAAPVNVDGIPAVAARRLTLDEAEAVLATWHHPRPRRWLDHKIERGDLDLEGDPPVLGGAAMWWLLLADECDKLYNQAWCALDQLRNAEDQDAVIMVAIDDLPSAIEQAFSLAPELAGEHLELLRGYQEPRYQELLRELGVGTDREPHERIACLEFWEENGERMSDLRLTLYRLVRRQLEKVVATMAEGDAIG